MSSEEDLEWTTLDYGLRINSVEESVDLLDDVEPSSQDLDAISVGSDDNAEADGTDLSENDYQDEFDVNPDPGPGLKGKNLALLLIGESSQVEDIVEDAGQETDCETVEGLQDRIPIGVLNDPFHNSFQTVDVGDGVPLPPSRMHTRMEEDLRSQVKSLRAKIRTLEIENERKAKLISKCKRFSVLWGVKKVGIEKKIKAKYYSHFRKKIRELTEKNEELESKYADLTVQKEIQEIQMQIVECASDTLTEANTRLAQENDELKRNQALTENTLFTCLDSLDWTKALGTEIPESIPGKTHAPTDSAEHLQETFAEAVVVSHAEVMVEGVPAEEPSSAASGELKREYEELLGTVGAQVSSTNEMTENESPTKKVKREQKGPRKVKDGYFRWTPDRNLKLLDAMVDILRETLEAFGENHVEKESDFLGKVSKRCGEMCPVAKIRDNVNNLLRKHRKGSNRDVKAEPRVYIKLLERIRTVVQKQQTKSATI